MKKHVFALTILAIGILTVWVLSHYIQKNQTNQTATTLESKVERRPALLAMGFQGKEDDLTQCHLETYVEKGLNIDSFTYRKLGPIKIYEVKLQFDGSEPENKSIFTRFDLVDESKCNCLGSEISWVLPPNNIEANVQTSLSKTFDGQVNRGQTYLYKVLCKGNPLFEIDLKFLP